MLNDDADDADGNVAETNHYAVDGNGDGADTDNDAVDED